MERAYHIGIIILLIAFAMKSYAQDEKDFVYYNQTTYSQYLSKDWEELIETGREAIKKDYDFYYLRTRMGIACYELKKYSTAIQHFEKALDLNASDPVIIEYLYYCYIYVSRYPDAVRLFQKYRDLLDERIIDYRPKLFDGIAIESGVKISDHTSGPGTEIGNLYYGQVGLSHSLWGRINIFQYLGYLNLGLEDHLTGQNNSIFIFPYNVHQFDYYLNARVVLGKGWVFIPTWHYIHVDVVSNSYNDRSCSVGISKHAGKIKSAIHFTRSDIIDSVFNQISISLSYYPFGNNQLYLNLSGFTTDGDLSQQVMGGTAGMRIIKNTWLEGFHHRGRSLFASFNEGFLIYNTPDYLLSRTGMILTHYLNDKSALSISYQLEKKERTGTDVPYSHHFLMFGMNLKF